MDIERAKEITKACTAHFFYREGLQKEPPPSLAEYSLAEMLEAQQVIKAANGTGNGGTSTIFCDDRLVAALYVAYHYAADPTGDCEAKAVSLDGRGVFVFDMREVDDVKG